MDTSRLGRGEMIAAASAIALLLIMFIFSWFGVEGFGANAWESFSFIDIILFITILVAIGLAVMKANSQSPNLPVAGSALVAGLGILSVLLIIYRIIDPPGGGEVETGFGAVELEIGRKIGVFLGLIAAGGIAYGGWESMREEGTSFQAQKDRLQSHDSTPGSSTGRDVPPPPPPATGGTATPPPPPPRDPGSNPPPAV